jgi:hypothetical protein
MERLQNALSPEFDALGAVDTPVQGILPRSRHEERQPHEQTSKAVWVERTLDEGEPALNEHLQACGVGSSESDQQKDAIANSYEFQWDSTQAGLIGENRGSREQQRYCGCDSQQQEATRWPAPGERRE